MTIPFRLGVVMMGSVMFIGLGVAAAQDWPQFRGPSRDNKVTGFTAPATWPKALKEKWSVKVGLGESSPVLVGNKLFVFGREDNDEVTTCLDAASGKVLWEDRYTAEEVKGAASRYPGVRSTPAVAEGKVFTLGVAGVVSCLDAASGKVAWREDTKSKPKFYTSTSPLVVDKMCIVYVGALTAFDVNTGKPKWEWTGGQTPYGSPVLMTVDGVKQIVTNASGQIVGISLDGKLLWKVDFGNAATWQSTYMTPIIHGDMVIYSSPGGKGGGGSTIAWKIAKKGDTFTATEVWKKTHAPYQYNTPTLKDGLIYGLSSGRNFFCMDAKTGDLLWTDKTKRGEAGAILNAGSVMLALTGDGELVAFEPSGKGYREIASLKVSATSGLPYPVIAGNRVYVKGRDTLTLWTME